MEILHGLTKIGEINENGLFKSTKMPYVDKITIHYKKAVYEAANEYSLAINQYFNGLFTHIKESFEKNNHGVPFTEEIYDIVEEEYKSSYLVSYPSTDIDDKTLKDCERISLLIKNLEGYGELDFD